MKRGIKKSLTGKVLLTLAICLFTFMLQAQIAVEEVVERFEIYHQQIPTEKVYLHTSREVLTLGDTLYLSAYVLDGNTHTPTTLSGLLHVDLIAPDASITNSLRLKIDSLGRSYGSFSLSDSLKAGIYTLRAYTQYQLNYDEDYLFSKAIKLLPRLDVQAIAEETSSQIPEISLQFFPEGGELIAGNTNFIAFKAVDQHGYPIEISGNIIDNTGEKVAYINTEHGGMGMFVLFIEEGKKYFCSFRFAGREFSQALPDMLPSGYLLHVHATKNRLNIGVKASKKSINQSFLVIQNRGRILYAIEPQPGASNIQLWLNHNDLPTGIIQLTFFDPQRRAVAERLIYNENPDTQTRLEITTDQKSYGKRSGVNIDLALGRANGEIPDLASLSTSVIPRNLYVAPEHTIASFLHLSSDLKGKINNPTYYFNSKNQDRLKHMDLLMMTHGWRRFDWEKVINLEGPEIIYPFEKGVRVEGKVTGYINKNKEVTTELYLSFLENPLIQLNTTSQEDGAFWFDGLNFTDTVIAYVKTLSDKVKKREAGKVNSNTLIHIDDPYVPPVSGNDQLYSITENDKQLINRGEKLFDIASAFDRRTIILDEISIEERIHPDNDPFNRPGMMHSTPSNRVILDSIPVFYTNIFQYLSTIPGVMVNGTQSVTIRGNTPMFLLDGFSLNFEQLTSINVRDILFIDVLKGPIAFAYGPRAIGGAIALFSRRGDEYDNLPEADPEGIIFFPLVGYTAPREFYMPNYSNPSESELVRPDFRSTLYWNPLLLVEGGQAKDHLFTSDEAGEFIIYSEGITVDGEVFTGEALFSVK